uniref:Gelsolin n=1 Tax=Peripatoides novaezealandiae TaxID=49105 RepID=A0A1B1HXZ7_9BILA|nr:gelsolin [Peripatoides novaezealandiae]
MAIDPAFENVGQQPGMEIWRIENFEVKPWDKEKHGTFYSGDSYVILKTKKVNNKFEWNIHFWLGKNTSQDEAGAAAIKAVELDDSLGGVPVQYREVQEHESTLLCSYFRKGIKYLEGGVASGFKHVDPNAVIKRLFQVKGKRNVKARQVEFSTNSMNKGDVFILDSKPNIYIWVGMNSGRLERMKATTVANSIRDETHGGRAEVIIIDAFNAAEEKNFFAELGSSGPIKDEGEDDAQFERNQQTEVSLWKVTDAKGKLETIKVSDRPIKQEYLDSNDCFILDAGKSGVFAWIGKQSTAREKEVAMKSATEYLKFREYPNWTPIQRVIDGGETPAFKQYFSSWKEAERTYAKNYVGPVAAPTTEKEFDVRSLHRKSRLHAKNFGKAVSFMPDDGSGKIEIWRIENFEMVPVDPNTYGFFFGGDSYVLKYTYLKEKREHYIVYFWQGLESTQDERASSAIWAVKLDDELLGRAIQVRIVQGRETEHFLKIFKGKLIIFTGGKASGFKNLKDHDTYDVDGTRMFHVCGTDDVDTRAIQVAEKASSLNSDDVFVLETPSATYLWFGKEASDVEKDMGRKVVSYVSPDRDPILINEGEEPGEFWDAIGGKGSYASSRNLPESPLLPTRLFQCSNASGRFRVEEVGRFRQQHLDGDDVMILDTLDELFIWVGKKANEDEKKLSFKLAEDYIRTDPTERDHDNTPILLIKQGEEPEAFTKHFKFWSPDFWAK